MKRIASFLFLVALVGCAGMQRTCSSGCASSLGADWVVVQFDMSGKPFNCWRLEGTSIDNESSSDGVYWLEGSGNLVHISGWYNRIQVKGANWQRAAESLGVQLDLCRDGRYDPRPLPALDKI